MSQPSWTCCSLRFMAGSSRMHRVVRAIDQQPTLQAGFAPPAPPRSPVRCRSSRPESALREPISHLLASASAARGTRRPAAGRSRADFRCSIISMAAMPARAAIGLPPNVAACMPGRRLGAISAVVSSAPPATPPQTRLGQRHDVGRDAEMLIGEPLAGAAAAGLHFVEHQQNARCRRPARADLAGIRRAECTTPPSPAPARPGSPRSRRRPAGATASRSPNGA